jgi:hypothetical protein
MNEGAPNRRNILLGGATLAAASTIAGRRSVQVAQAQLPPATQSNTALPNIVFILMDNLGYGEVGVYGGGITRGAPTPRIDQLAAEGRRLTNFNVEAQCTPSRSAIMTGLRHSLRYALGVGLKGYKEFGAQNRAPGWNLWLTFAISPAPPTPSLPAQSMAFK